MLPESAYWNSLRAFLRNRLEIARNDPDKGAMSAEAMIIIAALALVALTVMGIVTAKIVEKANSVNL
ncbi:hypothetical protein JYK22_02235, partial [Nonomuraea sp. RK-328]|nr:hypothetical protein [Nonomuraea sp. RK-328]